jgi:hypothetical protein
VKVVFVDTFFLLAALTLTDCISFSVLSEEGLSEALAGDRHFEQAGFTAVLRKED